MDVEPHIPDNILPWLIDHGFFAQPASATFHGAYDGGLFDHSYDVMLNLLILTETNHLVWQNERSLYVVGMFHDLCKIDQYTTVNDRYVFNRDTELKGHGSKSVILLSRLMDLTEEEKLCIRYHMGAFAGKSEWRDYTDAIHRYPNVLWTHHADMLAAHVDDL